MKRLKIWQLIVLLVIVVGASIVFVGAAAGWFSVPRVKLDSEYICSNCSSNFLELSGELYAELIEEKKSFVVFVDQSGCTTADRLREYVKQYAKEHGFRVYRMMFSVTMETSLHESVKFYPSVALISEGKVAAWLRADADEDADAYNNYDAFSKWMGERLVE